MPQSPRSKPAPRASAATIDPLSAPIGEPGGRLPLKAFSKAIHQAARDGDAAAIGALRSEEEAAGEPPAQRAANVLASIWGAMTLSIAKESRQPAFFALNRWLDDLESRFPAVVAPIDFFAATKHAKSEPRKSGRSAPAPIWLLSEREALGNARWMFLRICVEAARPVGDWMALSGGWPQRLRRDGLPLADALCAHQKRPDARSWVALFEAAEGKEGLSGPDGAAEWRSLSIGIASGLPKADLQAIWDRRAPDANRENELASAIADASRSRFTTPRSFNWAVATARSCPRLLAGGIFEKSLERALLGHQQKCFERLLRERIDWSRCWALGQALAMVELPSAAALLKAGASAREPANGPRVRELSPLCGALSLVGRDGEGEAWVRRLVAEGAPLRGLRGDAEPLSHVLRSCHSPEALTLLSQMGGIAPCDWEILKRATGWRPDGPPEDPEPCAEDTEVAESLHRQADALRAQHEADQLRAAVADSPLPPAGGSLPESAEQSGADPERAKNTPRRRL